MENASLSRSSYAKGDTVPKIFLEQYERYRTETAIRKKRYGLWKEYSWQESYSKARSLSLGLASLGLARGDKVCILGDNDPEYFWAEMAVQALGGIIVGIYIDAIPDEVKYIAGHSDARFMFVKDQEQVDKVLSIKDQLPLLERVIFWEPKGLWFYKDSMLLGFDDLLERGRAFGEGRNGFFEEEIQKGRSEEVCIISYTSGTTGLPKGAMITYEYLIHSIKEGIGRVDPWTREDRYLSYVPPAWATEHCFWVLALLSGASINFPEAPETLAENIREIGPTVMVYTPRMWESIMSTNEARIADSTWLKQWLWRKLFPRSARYAELEERGEHVGLGLRAMNALASHLLLRRVLDKMGFSRLRSAWTGGAPLSPSCFGYFRAMGLPIKQVYGSTEVMGVCCHTVDEVKWETLGRIVPMAEVRISEEGEILLRAEKMFSGYYKEPEKTEEALLDGRWFRTGDAGFFNDQQHLVYLDRMKDMVSLASGDKYAPQYIEGHLKFSNSIKDCLVTSGRDKRYITALINIDYESVGKWAEQNRINYTTYADLSQKPEVLRLIRRAVAEVNRRVPAAAIIRRFINLPKEFDPDEGELTRTRKIRRRFVEDKYQEIIQAMYDGQTRIDMKINVEYQDGRKDSYQVPVSIVDVEKEA
ncbi:MAG: AMP-binding protein [Proteobacteria bacterium]|nr:AMP-binding protein [Pseudomonadota bacterium]